MIRDARKSFSYFEGFIEEHQKRIENFTTKLESGSVKRDRIPAVIRKVRTLQLELIIAEYSNGRDISLLKQDFQSFIENLNDDVFEDSYSVTLQVVALAILLEVNSSALQKIRRQMKKQISEDWLIDYILSKGKNNKDSKNTLIPFYTEIKNAVEENDVHKAYLFIEKKWYPNSKECYWYETHKLAGNYYYGYWCFEGAALAKICGWDDTELNTSVYFPTGF